MKIGWSYGAGRPCSGAIRKSLAVCLAVAASVSAVRAHARESAPTLVIAARAAERERHAAVLDEVRTALTQLGAVELLPPPPLDLEAVQLAIDCPKESAECLREVAQRMDARVLLVAAVKRGDGEVGLRLLHFDLDSAEPPRTAVRVATGSELNRALLDQVPEMLRELLRVEVSPPEVAEAEVSPQPAAPTPQPAASARAVDRADTGSEVGPSLAPLLLGASGLAAVGAGVAFGALMNDSQEKYAARAIETEMQAEAAERDRTRGRRQALAANVLLGAGAAAVVAAGIWLALDSGDEDRPARAALLPTVGPGSAGLAVLGTWETKQ